MKFDLTLLLEGRGKTIERTEQEILEENLEDVLEASATRIPRGKILHWVYKFTICRSNESHPR